MDDDLSFESWEAVEDVYEEMLGEEYEVEKLRKAKARTRLNARRDPELTLDTAEKEDTTSEGATRVFFSPPFLYLYLHTAVPEGV